MSISLKIEVKWSQSLYQMLKIRNAETDFRISISRKCSPVTMSLETQPMMKYFFNRTCIPDKVMTAHHCSFHL